MQLLFVEENLEAIATLLQLKPLPGLEMNSCEVHCILKSCNGRLLECAVVESLHPVVEEGEVKGN